MPKEGVRQLGDLGKGILRIGFLLLHASFEISCELAILAVLLAHLSWGVTLRTVDSFGHCPSSQSCCRRHSVSNRSHRLKRECCVGAPCAVDLAAELACFLGCTGTSGWPQSARTMILLSKSTTFRFLVDFPAALDLTALC